MAKDKKKGNAPSWEDPDPSIPAIPRRGPAGFVPPAPQGQPAFPFQSPPDAGANPTGQKAKPKADPKAAATKSATPQGPPSNAFDPLALQQMWAQVFGPAFQQAAQIAGNVGPDYLSAMKQAIAGSNEPGNMQKQQLAQAQAMSDLLQHNAGVQLEQVATGPSFDQLINWLQQATGAAQLAQGTGEKSIAYGGALQNAAAFGAPGAAGASAGAALSPQQAAQLTQSALSGTQTGSALAGTSGNNPFLPQQLLQQQGLP